MKLNQIPAPSFIDSGWRAWSMGLVQTVLLCALVAVVITLANVQALIDTEPASAKAMVAGLTRLLRTNLQRTRDEATTLGEEMAVVDAYLAIQAIRMGSRLQYVLKVPAEARDWPLPPLLVQPLVENAVLHGIDIRPEGGSVEVSVREEAGERVISVCDDGPGPGGDSSDLDMGTGSNGIGLTNVRTRLAAVYGEQARLTLQARSGGGFCAALRLPDDD